MDPRTLDCVSRLIGFDTVSRNGNLDCIEWAAAHLAAHGARIRIDQAADPRKRNLLASFGEGEDALILSGHVDVVPVDGQPWTSDPFKAEIRGDRLYGRGACDMKGFVGAVLGHAPDYAAADRPIHVALTYDEEQGCLGIPHLIAAMQDWGVRAAGCIVGEPTSMRLVSAHKGGEVWRCRITGKAAHSSLTHMAVNAIEYAARLIACIQRIADREREDGVRAEGFDVPFTTISTNLCEGGNAPNIVPASATFQFDFRYIPGFDPDSIMAELRTLAGELQARMRSIDPASGIVFERINAIPALAPDEGSTVFALARGFAPGPVAKVAYGTEAGFFQRFGVPTVIIGPGSIEQAHKADEYVALDQLARCDHFLDRISGLS